MDFSEHTWVCYLVLSAIVTLSAIIDYKHHRIPNWLSFSGWYIGPILHFYIAGAAALSGSLMGLALVFVLTFPLFVVKWMGAGDVKLMTSVGALVAVDQAMLFLISIVMSGFILGVAQLVLRGMFQSYIRRYRTIVGLSLASGRPVYIAPENTQQTVIMPYAIPIAVGSMTALCLLWW